MNRQERRSVFNAAGGIAVTIAAITFSGCATILDNDSYNRARWEGNAAAYRTYLRDFPNGLHVEEARTQLAQMEAAEACRAETQRQQVEAERRRARSIVDNWTKLRAGLSADEVKSIVESVESSLVQNIIFLTSGGPGGRASVTRRFSDPEAIKTLVDAGYHLEPSTHQGAKVELYFELQFDAANHLRDWVPRK